MAKMATSILLMLSLEVLLVARLSAAAAGTGGDTDIIHLPSDAEGFAYQAMARPGDEERPWKCCDKPLCYQSWPVQHCSCTDKVERCSDACKMCLKVEGSDPARYVCADWYRGEPGRRCHDQEEEDNHAGVVVTGAKNKSHGERPWRCCDRAVPGPSASRTPVWYCMDKFGRCDCERCVEVADSHSYFCLDGYKGRDPGPSCTHGAYDMMNV
ncbi:hypothetical protein ACP70R_050188 [Stipagrostis hirtigluma subsp. patula]